jgi:hypothetical protein
MTRSIAFSLLLGFAFALAAQTLAVPPPPPPPAPDASPQSTSSLSGSAAYSIAGTVESASTGMPLDRAEVTLSTPGPQGTSLATTITSETGAFRFDRLQAGKYRLQASRRGYTTAGYQEHEGFFTAIVTGPDQDTTGLRLRLLPSAVIGGVVTDDSGEPVPGARLRLYRQDPNAGDSRIVGAGSDTTDDTGVYEFARLHPGTYYVGVMAAPWYAFHPPRRMDAANNVLPDDQQPHSPLDVAYPTTFYPNATDSAAAAPIVLSAGDHTEIDLSLHVVAAIHVEVRLPAPESGRGIPGPQIGQEIFGAEEFGPPGLSQIMRSNGQLVADLRGVAPGQYFIRQSGLDGEPGRSATVDLSGNQVVDFSSLSVSGVDVSGKLARASGEKFPRRTTVSLTSPEGHGGASSPVDANGSFNIHSVAPGAWEVEVHAPGGTLAVTQMAASGGTALGDRITVAGDSPVLLAATVADGSASISGFAQRNGRGMGGVMILLVPRDPHASRQLYRRDQSDSDGSFTLTRVIPGSYTLVAIDDGWSLDWARPDAIAPYLARGVAIRIATEKRLDLPNPVDVQQR